MQHPLAQFTVHSQSGSNTTQRAYYQQVAALSAHTTYGTVPLINLPSVGPRKRMIGGHVDDHKDRVQLLQTRIQCGLQGASFRLKISVYHWLQALQCLLEVTASVSEKVSTRFSNLTIIC